MGTVRAAARAESFAVAYTSDPALVVVSDTDVGPHAELVAQIVPVPPAPLNAMSVNDWWNEFVIPWTDVTVPFVTGAAAFAVQISAVPNCVFDRLASVHVRPAPLIDSVCLEDWLVTPADVANSTSNSSGPLVLKAGVVTVPTPSAGNAFVAGSTPPRPSGPVRNSAAA